MALSLAGNNLGGQPPPNAGRIANVHSSLAEIFGCKFDPDGDLTLIIGSDNVDVTVDSNALCRLSIVFRKMLRGPWLEAKPASGEWRVHLPEDNAYAFSFILDMVHCRYEKPVRGHSLAMMFSILIIVNKYNMYRLIRPVAKSWMTDAIKQAKPDLVSQYRLLFVAWGLGDDATFCQTAKSIALSFPVNWAGNHFDANTGVVLQNLFGLHLMNVAELIKAHRIQAVSIINQSCRMVVGHLGLTIAPCGHCGSLDDAARRHREVRRCLIARSQVLGISNLFNTDTPDAVFFESVNKVLKTISEVDRDVPFSCMHTFFQVDGLSRRIETQINGMDSALTSVHLDYLKAQAARTDVQGRVHPI